ncbi:MAG: CoA-binding protein [Saprospiraceae bacterium]
MSQKENSKSTLVIGAVNRPEKYAFLAVKSLLHHGHPVTALGIRSGYIEDIEIHTEKKIFENIDTITLYINPSIQIEYYDYILQTKPKRVVFNPGTENSEFYPILTANGILVEEACTLVLLSTGQY